MNYKVGDYTFWGLFNNGIEVKTPIKTLAYIIGLVDSAKNGILDLDTAKFILPYLFDAEEQVESASELLSVQDKSCPRGFYPQTPVMLTIKWSPIAALLEQGWNPIVLNRETKRMACASGVWQIKDIEKIELHGRPQTPDDLFWNVLSKVITKADTRGLLLSLTAMPGWSYESNFGRPANLTLAEAEKADRVIWQRTPVQTLP